MGNFQLARQIFLTRVHDHETQQGEKKAAIATLDEGQFFGESVHVRGVEEDGRWRSGVGLR